MNLRKTTIAGFKWSTIGTVGKALFQLLQVAILTRYLPKEAFGLVAMALFVVQFTDVFADMGMTTAILHRQNATNKEYSSIFWLNVLITLLLFGLLYIATPIVSRFYNEPELDRIIPILGTNLLIMAVGRQKRTIMQKDFEFKSIVIIELFSFFIGLIVAVILAIKDFGVYSLVYSTLAASLISNGLFFIQNNRSNPVKFHFRLSETKPFLKVGSFNMGSSLLDFFSRSIDILIIGKMFGAGTLGLYSLTKQLAMKQYNIITPIVFNVLNPVLSSLQKEKEKLNFYYLQIIYHITSLTIPLCLLTIILSKEILSILYGPEYISGYMILSFLIIYFGLIMVIKPIGSLQIATGRTDIGFKWSIMRITITPLFIFIAAHISIELVAATITLVGILLVCLLWPIQIRNMTNIRFLDYVQQFLKPYLLLLSLTGIYLVWEQFFSLPLGLVANIIIKSAASMALYWGLLWLIERKRITEMLKLVLGKTRTNTL
jgi:O-antigen/teichoic acid export membrane protein